jgi:hypothetical protein
MRTTQIPATVAEAKGVLTGLDALLTSKGWERAAIVFAFTTLGEHGGDRSKVRSDLALTPAEFAELSIAGLSSKNTVQRYHEMWVKHGDTSIKPGDVVTLPSIGFPPEDRNKGTRMPKDVKALAGKIAEMDDEDKRAFAIEVAQDDTVRNEVTMEGHRQFEKKRKERRRDKGPVKKYTTMLDGSLICGILGSVINDLEDAEKRIKENMDPSTFTPDEHKVIDMSFDEIELLITSVKAALDPNNWDAALHELKETG